MAHYHSERNHQGLDSVIIHPDEHVGVDGGTIKTRSRLGGLLNYYYREAARSADPPPAIGPGSSMHFPARLEWVFDAHGRSCVAHPRSYPWDPGGNRRCLSRQHNANPNFYPPIRPRLNFGTGRRHHYRLHEAAGPLQGQEAILQAEMG